MDRSAALAWEKELLTDEDATWEAMLRAGGAVGQGIWEDFLEIGPWPNAPRILVLAGTGHNGGDALLAAAEILRQRPAARITAVLTHPSKQLKPLTRRALERLQSQGNEQVTVLTREAVDRLCGTWQVAIDGVAGMQFSPPWRDGLEELIGWVNRLGERVLLRAAVDLPSGLEEKGVSAPEHVFHADFTYATGIVKAPLVEVAQAQFVGRLRYLDLGFFANQRPPAFQGQYVLSDSVLDSLRRLRPAGQDKRHYGHLFVLGGSRFMSGAVQMAIQAAVRSGVGLVTGLIAAPMVSRLAPLVPESMWLPLPTQPDGLLALETLIVTRHNMERAQAMVIGPGMEVDKHTRNLIARLAREISLPLLLDAGALQADIMPAVVGRSEESGPVIMTPHWGEFYRISRLEGAGYPSNRDLQEFCQKHHAVTVLKGPLTRISDGEIVIYIPRGGPVLARGGSGDLLAGIIGAQFAQMPTDPLAAACRGACWHALAADLLAQARGQTAVATTELLDFLSAALRRRLPLP